MRQPAFIVVLALAGCGFSNAPFFGGGYAQERKWEPPNGGVIALKGNREKAQRQAEQFMAERCEARPYRIVSEEDYLYGGDLQGGERSELRLAYVCLSPAPATPSVPPPAAAPAPAASTR